MTFPPRAGRRASGGLAVLLAVTFVAAAANGVIFPLLAGLQEEHGLPTWGLGLISGATFAFGLLAQLLLSPQADRGRARGLLGAGLALTAAALLWFALGTELWEFVAARSLSGLALGCFLPAARAIAATADPARVGRNLGRLASAELGGFIAGPVFGSTLVDRFGLDAPFVVLAGLAGVGLVGVTACRLPDVRGPRAAVGQRSWPLLRRRSVLAAALMSLSLYLPVGVYDALWARYLDDRGASTAFIGASLALYGLPFVALASLGGRLADRHGPVPAVAGGLVVIVPTTFLYGTLSSPGAIVLVAILEAVGQAAAVPGAQAAMARACPGRVAAGQGLAGAVNLAGAGVAAVAAPPLYEAAGPAAVFGVVAALMAGLGATSAWLHLAPGLGRRELSQEGSRGYGGRVSTGT